jgi:hypothetical protein
MTRAAAGSRKKADQEKDAKGMDTEHRTSEDVNSDAEESAKQEERRSRRRDEGALSRIEDITYSVLRKHKSQP